jgi:hypothetical protein
LDLGVNEFGKVQKFFVEERGLQKGENNAETLRAGRSAEKRKKDAVLRHYEDYVTLLDHGSGHGCPVPLQVRGPKQTPLD